MTLLTLKFIQSHIFILIDFNFISCITFFKLQQNSSVWYFRLTLVKVNYTLVLTIYEKRILHKLGSVYWIGKVQKTCTRSDSPFWLSNQGLVFTVTLYSRERVPPRRSPQKAEKSPHGSSSRNGKITEGKSPNCTIEQKKQSAKQKQLMYDALITIMVTVKANESGQFVRLTQNFKPIFTNPMLFLNFLCAPPSPKEPHTP